MRYILNYFVATTAGLLLAACASTPPLPPPVTWTVVDHVQCSASVHITTAMAEDGRSVTIAAPSTDVTFETSHWDKRRPAVELADTVRLTWQAPVRRSSTGETTTDTDVKLAVQGIAFTGRLSGKRWNGPYPGDVHYAACGKQSEWEVKFPTERRVVVTSDPAGASIFRQDDSWDVPEFLGTAPDTLIMLWHKNQSRKGLLFRKSGHEDVREQLEWNERTLRVILHPLPHRRPDGP